MKNEEKFVQRFMRWTSKLKFMLGPADRDYDDAESTAGRIECELQHRIDEGSRLQKMSFDPEKELHDAILKGSKV